MKTARARDRRTRLLRRRMTGIVLILILIRLMMLVLLHRGDSSMERVAISLGLVMTWRGRGSKRLRRKTWICHLEKRTRVEKMGRARNSSRRITGMATNRGRSTLGTLTGIKKARQATSILCKLPIRRKKATAACMTIVRRK